MVVAAAIVVDRWVEYVKHLVEDDVIDHITRSIVGIKRAAYDDGLVCCIVMSQDPIRFSCRPGKRGLLKASLKINLVEPVKYL